MDQWELVLLKAQQYIGLPEFCALTLESDGTSTALDPNEGEGEELPDHLLTEAEYEVNARWTTADCYVAICLVLLRV